MSAADFLVVGGGLVGAAIGYGLAKRGARVTLIDEGDTALRAARGNFGNVWVQGKGIGRPHYAAASRAAALAWPALAAELADRSAIDVGFRRPGGAFVMFSAEELTRRHALLAAEEEAAVIPIGLELLDAAELRRHFPGLGPAVAGATYCGLDGACDPLLLLRALIASFRRAGGRHVTGARIGAVRPDGAGFAAGSDTSSDGAPFLGERVIVAAGLGAAALAPPLGLAAPIRPVRGQLFVTEPVERFMPINMHFIRQGANGAVLCGDSSEEAGLDESTTAEMVARSARLLLSVFPALRQVKMVRAWGALRVMSPDGEPLCEEAARHPGAYLVSAHSAVTLAPFLVDRLAAALLDGSFAAVAGPYSPRRFDA